MVYFAIFAENWKTGPKQRQDFRSDWTATAGQDDDRSLQLGSWCVWALAGDCIERDAAAADLLEDLHIAESDCQARHAANYGHGPTGPATPRLLNAWSPPRTRSSQRSPATSHHELTDSKVVITVCRKDPRLIRFTGIFAPCWS